MKGGEGRLKATGGKAAPAKSRKRRCNQTTRLSAAEAKALSRGFGKPLRKEGESVNPSGQSWPTELKLGVKEGSRSVDKERPVGTESA